MVRRPRARRHDRALCRALHELRVDARGTAVGPPRHRHRADGQRPGTVQPPPPRAGRADQGRHPRRGRHSDGIPRASAGRAKPPAHRRARPQSRLPRAGGSAARLSAGRRGADDRMRQDHARMPDGRGHRRPARDRAVGRPDARRLARGQAGRLRHGDLACAQPARGRRDRLRRLHAADHGFVPVDRPLQHHGHRAVDEQPGRGAGHVAAGLREHSRGLSRARPDGLRDRQARGRARSRRSSPVGDHDARGVRECDRRRVRAGRIDQLPAAPDRDRTPHGRRAEPGRLAALR